MVEDYNSVHKDKCAKEFLKLKDCYLVGRSQVRIPFRFISSSLVQKAAAKEKR